jgi:hypothetical protein
MAIVRDLSGNVPQVDQAFKTYTRTSAGEPNSSLTPAFAGEIVLDTTGNALWYAAGISNTSWVMLTPV